jgi:hypothetical protein
VNNILELFFEELTEEGKICVYFQQDNSRSSTYAQNLLKAVWTIFIE